MDKQAFLEACVDQCGGIRFGKDNIKIGYYVKVNGDRYAEVIGAGPQNITYRILTGGAKGMVLTAAYAEITEIVKAEEDRETHPFTVGERFTAEQYVQDGDSLKWERVRVTYGIVKTSSKTIQLKPIDRDMKRVQAALKDDKRVPDALKVYWVRKVTDRWYANVGKYDVRLALRRIEQNCDEIRKQILSQSSLEEMIAAHDFYMGQVDSSFLEVKNQIQAVIRMVKFLQRMGFKYVDHGCKIRYAFLGPEDRDGICDTILTNIHSTIQDRAPSCQITCEAKGAAVEDAGFFLELAFDYWEKICMLTQFTPVFR